MKCKNILMTKATLGKIAKLKLEVCDLQDLIDDKTFEIEELIKTEDDRIVEAKKIEGARFVANLKKINKQKVIENTNIFVSDKF